MPRDEAVEAWLRLTLTPALRPVELRRLLSELGDPLRVLATGKSQLARIAGERAAEAVVRGPKSQVLAAALAWAGHSENQVVTLADTAYPPALLQIPDPPLLLYVIGRTELLHRPSLAIVGSRNATAQGALNAESFAETLSNAGLVIVSGLALGIDAAAHRGGLAGSAGSLAVTGTGLDVVYPARNRALAHDLAERGALIAEFPPGTPARPENFPRRNRLIAGLALGCLVVEASLGSGSLITARCAADQGREVFALPGSIHSPLAKGCHALIKQGAKLVESAADILEELRFAPADGGARTGGVPGNLTGEERRLLDAIGFEPVDPDTLAARTGLSAAEVSALLTRLELSGTVNALPGRRFQRVR